MSLYGYFSKIFSPSDKSKGGFKIPEFLLNRKISEYDAPELRELFRQNNIQNFGDLTVEMIRAFLKYSYSDAIYVIELLGLYGVKFTSAKLKHFSEPDTDNYRLLKFNRDTSEIDIEQSTPYEFEAVILKRYLFDMKLSTSFMLDGIKIDVLLGHLGLPECVLQKLLHYDVYPETSLNSIYADRDNSVDLIDISQNHDVISANVSRISNENATISDDSLMEFNEKAKEIPSYVANIKLPRPEFSVRLKNILINENIDSIGKLISYTVSELLRIPNFGRKSLRELSYYLEGYNIQLGKNYRIVENDNLDKDFDTDNIKSSDIDNSVQKIPSYIAAVKLPRPEFSVRLSNALTNEKISSIRDLLDYSYSMLLRIPNFGRKSLNELIGYIETQNIKLGHPYEIIEMNEPCIDISDRVSNVVQQIKDFEDKFYEIERKKTVYNNRINSKKKVTLQALADQFEITRERVRQIEHSLLRRLEKIIVSNLDVFNDIFEKYGDIIAYQNIPELEVFRSRHIIFRNIFNFSSDVPFELDTDLEVLITKDLDFDELMVDQREDVYLDYSNIENEIKEKLITFLKKEGRDQNDNFNVILQKLVDYNIENNFVYNQDKGCYLAKEYSKGSEQLDLAFKELYPNGVFLRQQIDEVFDKIIARCPSIDCSTPKALEARLTGHSKNIILTGSGFYQHIDTIHVDKDVILFAADECKNKLSVDGHPFLISMIFEKHKEYFENHGVFSDYLLFSLLKRLNDPTLFLKRLTVYKACDDNISMLEYFEKYFKSQQGLVPVKEAEDYFASIGWNDLRVSNYLNNSSKVFKLSIGYFYKDNVTCNIDKLKSLMEKVRTKIEECRCVSLDYIREKNFVDWLEVFHHEDLDARSMASIIKAFYPECPYEVSGNGLISDGSILKPYEALYQWMTQKCEEDDFVTNGQITDFCIDNKFHKYNTKAQIKDQIAEIAEECFVTYDYLGLDKKQAIHIEENIKKVIKNSELPYLSISQIISKITLPDIKKTEWNEYLVRSIIENAGDLTLYNLVVVNPFQTKITTRDQIVANEIYNFTKTWYMDADKLERLLRRNKIFKKNETLSHRGVMNDLFSESSCLELRDQNKNVCIKAEYRELYV